MCFASLGPIKYMDEVMSVYRIHDKGVWSELSIQEQLLKNLEGTLKINKAFNYKYEDNLISSFCRNIINNLNILTIEEIIKLISTLEKNDLMRIMRLFLNEVEILKINIEQKEEYINEKHEIIGWYEKVLKEKEEYINKNCIYINLLKKILSKLKFFKI